VAGILINLGKNVTGGNEILFDILYNETQAGTLRRQAHIHGQFYDDLGTRHGMVQNGNVSVPVFVFRGTIEGIGNTNVYLWIPSSNTAYYPSVKVEAWYRGGGGALFTKFSIVVSTLASAPVETLVEIAEFNSAHMIAPDYNKKETTNRISTRGGKWLVDRNGFVIVGYIPIAGDWFDVNIFEADDTGGISVWRTCNIAEGTTEGVKKVLPVVKNTKVQIICQNTSGMTDISCYFIPPLAVRL
jgi:hypothetical protein